MRAMIEKVIDTLKANGLEEFIKPIGYLIGKKEKVVSIIWGLLSLN
jgi:biotin operon repressor